MRLRLSRPTCWRIYLFQPEDEDGPHRSLGDLHERDIDH